MDPLKNPFSPGAGSPPPELAGRSDLLSQMRILLTRVKNAHSEKGTILVGLRGVGKTVLLNEIQKIADDLEYKSFLVEAHEGKTLSSLIVPSLRNVLYQLDRMENFSRKTRRALTILKSFLTGLKITVHDIEIGLDIDPEKGIADSGDLEADLPELFVAVAEAAQERKTAIAILIDEIQYLTRQELSALIMAVHKIAQKSLPLTLIGAGLPIMPGLAGESKSYAERLFNFPEIGPLVSSDAVLALQDPVKKQEICFSQEALDKIYSLTQGYPYFLQEWGYQVWNHAAESPIQLTDVQKATTQAVARLDKNFFRVRFDRLTPREKVYLRALAELGPGVWRSGEVADKLGVSVYSVAPVRASLIKKGMVYSPAHGETAFTVPLFEDFIIRAIPEAPKQKKSN